MGMYVPDSLQWTVNWSAAIRQSSNKHSASIMSMGKLTFPKARDGETSVKIIHPGSSADSGGIGLTNHTVPRWASSTEMFFWLEKEDDMIVPKYRKAVLPSCLLGEQGDLRAVNRVSERAIVPVVGEPIVAIRKGR